MKNRNLQSGDHWKTPDYIYEPLNQEFNFTFDPCPYMHSISKWDGLEIEWKGNSIFVNPPYSQKLKERFIKKAVTESRKDKNCVMLLSVSTSTKIFHEVVLPNKKEIRFVKGRIKFEGINTRGELVKNKCGMHDSMIVVF